MVLTVRPKLIILDRDGVINFDSPAYIKTPEEWQPIPGSLEAIAQLNKVGCRVAIASNQAGIGRGYFSEEALAQIHAKLLQALTAIGGRVDGIFYCPHAPVDQCACRKPKPGLLFTIFEQYGIGAEDAVMVGDSLRDLEAASAAGCGAVLVETGNGSALCAQRPALKKSQAVHADLFAYVQTLF